jgi:hypothetical protein
MKFNEIIPVLFTSIFGFWFLAFGTYGVIIPPQNNGVFLLVLFALVLAFVTCLWAVISVDIGSDA